MDNVERYKEAVRNYLLLDEQGLLEDDAEFYKHYGELKAIGESLGLSKADQNRIGFEVQQEIPWRRDRPRGDALDKLFKDRLRVLGWDISTRSDGSINMHSKTLKEAYMWAMATLWG